MNTSHKEQAERGLAILRGEIVVGEPLPRISVAEWKALGLPVTRSYATFAPHQFKPASNCQVSRQPQEEQK